MPPTILQVPIARHDMFERTLPPGPTVDVVIIDSRSKDGVRSAAWVGQAIDSVRANQYLHLGLQVVDNTDRAWSIGACWNAAVAASEADLVFFLGDDDFLAYDCIGALAACFQYVEAVAPATHQDLVHVTCGYTAIDENGRQLAYAPEQHVTGMYRRTWLLEHPFDATMRRLVDTDMAQRIAALQKMRGNLMYMALRHYLGYYYRQHVGMVSGQKYAVAPPAAPSTKMKLHL